MRSDEEGFCFHKNLISSAVYFICFLIILPWNLFTFEIKKIESLFPKPKTNGTEKNKNQYANTPIYSHIIRVRVTRIRLIMLFGFESGKEMMII